MKPQKTVLVAPLDWGLGHATRCMPLIDLLLKKDHRVIIAGNADSFFLLKEQYPQLTFYELPGYNISYPAGKNAATASLFQAPKILQTIQKENKAIEKILKVEKIDLIISDNRYGVRSAGVKSILICHHIAMQAPHHLRFMNPLFLKLHLQQINKFDALWIPDEEGENNLSGKLSHDISFKIPHTYVGIQSRFFNFNKTTSFVDELDFTMLAVLSGPEPQRSFLQQELMRKLSWLPDKVLFVEGRTEKQTNSTEGNITTVSYLNTNDLFTALQKASVIICRSGYSTVMDLAVLGKKAICIPANGQTEQEYLGKSLSEKGFVVLCDQDKLDLDSALKQQETIPGFPAYKTSTDKMEMELEKYLT
ncbi:MAG: glycosyltransferase [Bacteroidota bacterium]|nr:glycosyltransferase [Bacteroidota bacterium]